METDMEILSTHPATDSDPALARYRDSGGADLATIAGIVAGLVSLLIMMTMEGSSPMSIILTAPMILIFGGTFGAAIAGLPMSDAKRVGVWFKQALVPEKLPATSAQIDTLVGLAEKARKEGLLALENEAKSATDPFLRKGLEMLVDGADSDVLRTIMESEIDSKRAEDKVGAKFFGAMGGYAPTIGIIGTVVGLIHVLENLDKPETLGPLIAGAFIATLWGVMTANFFWLPMGAKVARMSEIQISQMEMLVEGISEIQSGTSPRAVRQKLMALVPPSEASRVTA
jgi:chemotaxis protein MotA